MRNICAFLHKFLFSWTFWTFWTFWISF